MSLEQKYNLLYEFLEDLSCDPPIVNIQDAHTEARDLMKKIWELDNAK